MFKKALWFVSPLFLIAGLVWAAEINTSGRCSTGANCSIGGGKPTSFTIDTDGTGGLDEFTTPDITFEAQGDAILNSAAGEFTFTRDESGTVVILAADDNAVAALTINSGDTGTLTVTPGGAGAMQIGSATTTTLSIDNNGAMTIGDATTTDSMDLATAGAMTIGGATTTDSITLATAGAIAIGTAAADTVTLIATGAFDIGNNVATVVTIDTDGTGDAELVLPTDSVGADELNSGDVCGTLFYAQVDPTEASATDDFMSFWDHGGSTTEGNEDEFGANASLLTVHSLSCLTATAPGAGNDAWAITIRDDGGDTAVTCTIDEAATTCDDTTNSATVAAQSLMNFDISSAGGDADPTATALMTCTVCMGP